MKNKNLYRGFKRTVVWRGYAVGVSVMIKSKPGKQFAAASQALCLQVLTDDPGDNTYGHTPLHIQTGDGKRYIVLFAGHPVVIAGVG